MKVTYDEQAKALYIELRTIGDGEVHTTEELVPDTVKIDKTILGEIVGVEVLGVPKIEED